jgi:tetratricopeptide (TPR) repeat protein
MNYRDSLAVSRPFQMSLHAANSYVGLAQSLLCQGKVDQASESLQESFRLAQEINARDVIVEAYCTLAEIQLAKDMLLEAEENAQNAVRLASEIGVNLLLIIAWRLTSTSLLRQGRIEDARQALENAWKAFANGPDKIEEGRLHAQAMLVALAAGDRQEAQIRRAEAEQIFTQLGASRDLSLLQPLEMI